MSTEATTGTSQLQIPALDRRADLIAATTKAFPAWQRAVMIGAPLLMGGPLLLHPGLEVPREEWVPRLAALLGRWIALHLVLLPLFALFA